MNGSSPNNWRYDPPHDYDDDEDSGWKQPTPSFWTWLLIGIVLLVAIGVMWPKQ
jgi:hypothetical protein